MSGLQRTDEQINGVDVREQGNALRVATNTPHLVSLGTGRFSTAVTLHPIKQGRMTIGSDASSDIRVTGEGVQPAHCRVESSHGVFTIYPNNGDTRLDATPLTAPARLSQGCMITLGRSTYLRYNNPAEAHLMKSVLPTMTEDGQNGYAKNNESNHQSYQNQNRNYKDHTLNHLDHELNMTLKEIGRKKPPAVPKKPNREDYDESQPKMSSIMAKVSKFEYYAKTQQKSVGKSHFYTNDNDISPKVFSSNSLTVNTPAKDVLGKIPTNFKNNREQKVVFLPENNVLDPKSCSYANVAIRNRTKIDDIVRNFDENRPQLPKKVNNTETPIYGKINNDVKIKEENRKKPGLPSPAFDRNPQYSPVYGNSSHYERSYEAENRRIQAYQDRIKEEEQQEVENARLEEILSMCAEYERQASAGTPVTPTEKRSHNKIITNGSLPRSVALNNPNFVQTSEGYYKFDTSHNRTNSQMSQSLPIQRNVSSYENYDVTQIQDGGKSESLEIKNVGRMDEIGIPVYEETLSSPVLIRKICDTSSPIGSPYENVYYRNFKPKSPNSQSPRTRIKTSFAHKNLPSPQYFVFPTPPPADNTKKPTFVIPEKKEKFDGIEKQLSLEEEIPMIDDSNISDDIEFRYAKVDKTDTETELVKNKSFDDVKKELMADIPELDEFEKDLKQNREKIVNNVKENVITEVEANVDTPSDVTELRKKYESLKESRKKLLAEIHEYKCKMTEIRSQEDDVLRELEMEKALIKGEYDSEIAILNIEQKKKIDLMERARRIEDEIKELKAKQEARQNEMADRVEIATLKVERIEKDIKNESATNEELQNAQDILDNETKIYEDLEFQHLEEESELLANREDLQNEISLLTKKIDAQKSRILTLKSEANNNLTSALDETKVLQAEYVKMLNKVEEITTKVQAIEKELKPIVLKLNDIERTQSPDSAFYTDQRSKSGEFGYSPQSSDSDDLDTKVTNYETHAQFLKDKFNSVDQMSQSMIVDIERRDISEIVDIRGSESPSKSSTSSKEKKGFWERNFDSLSRRKKKPKSPDKVANVDIMSQSLNENMFYNDNIENETPFDKFNSLRHSKKKEKNGPLKSNSSSKIPTFAALGKIIKKDSFGKKKETDNNIDEQRNNVKNRYVKNAKPATENKYAKKTPDKILEENTNKNDYPKVLHRKSCGDEPNSNNSIKISDSGKIPSQDDIDRISKVTLDAPILSSETDMDTLGKKAVNSLMEIERKRLVMLEEQGCQVIENERDRISELKRRVQDETKKMWDQKYKNEHTKSFDSDTCNSMVSDFDSLQNSLTEPYTMSERLERGENSLDITGSTVFDESAGLMSSIEELQVRNSRTESNEEEKRSDESRPLSHASDFSRENILSLNNAPRRSRRTIAPYGESQRPLTRYLPVGDRGDFDLRRHVESAGHQVELCPHVAVSVSSCRGYLHKLGAKFHTWSKRWFVFDRDTKTFVYYWDKSERKPRGGAYFQVIEEVYLDHGNTSRSPSPHTTFIVKTRQRRYYLMAASGEAARIWIDVIFTGAQGYTEYLE